MNIQDAIKSGKPFCRKAWGDELFIAYSQDDIVLSLATDFSISIELDVQDILAEDWYTRDELPAAV